MNGRNKVSARLTDTANKYLRDMTGRLNVGPTKAFDLIIRDLRLAGKLGTIHTAETLRNEALSIPLCMMVADDELNLLKMCVENTQSTLSRVVNKLIETHLLMSGEEIAALPQGIQKLCGVGQLQIRLDPLVNAFIQDQANLLGINDRTLVADIVTRYARRQGLKGVRTVQVKARKPNKQTLKKYKKDYATYGERQITIMTQITEATAEYLEQYATRGGFTVNESLLHVFHDLETRDALELKQIIPFGSLVLHTPQKFRVRLTDNRRIMDMVNRFAAYAVARLPKDTVRGYAIANYIHLHKQLMAGKQAITEQTPAPEQLIQDTTTDYSGGYPSVPGIWYVTTNSHRFLPEKVLYTPKYTVLGPSWFTPSSKCDDNWLFRYGSAREARSQIYALAALWHDDMARGARWEAREALKHGDTVTTSQALTAAHLHGILAEMAHTDTISCRDGSCHRCQVIAGPDDPPSWIFPPKYLGPFTAPENA